MATTTENLWPTEVEGHLAEGMRGMSFGLATDSDSDGNLGWVWVLDAAEGCKSRQGGALTQLAAFYVCTGN